MEREINKTARVILEIDNKLIFIKRIKKDKNNEENLVEYYATVGGHLEVGETFEDAAIRETYEELGVNVKLERVFMEWYNNEIDTEEKYYLASYINGEIGTGKGEEFDGSRKDFEEFGSYEIVRIDKNNLRNIEILPKELKEKIIEHYN